MQRRRSIEIYLKNGVPADDYIHEIWKSMKVYGHPQAMFRRALMIGLNHMVDSGEIPALGFDYKPLPNSFYDTGVIRNPLQDEIQRHPSHQPRHTPQNIVPEPQPVASPKVTETPAQTAPAPPPVRPPKPEKTDNTVIPMPQKVTEQKEKSNDTPVKKGRLGKFM